MTPFDPWDPRSPAWSERLAFVRRVLSSARYELSPEDREELAQEALVDLFERSRSERPRNPEGLLRTIAHRKAVDLFRGRTRWRLILDGSDPETADAADAHADPTESLRASLVEALPALADAYFRRHHPDCLPHARAYFDGGVWKDLAKDKDQKVNTVIQQWTRCRGALVAHLRARGLAWVLGEGRRDG